jgi:hypothetical protein
LAVSRNAHEHRIRVVFSLSEPAKDFRFLHSVPFAGFLASAAAAALTCRAAVGRLTHIRVTKQLKWRKCSFTSEGNFRSQTIIVPTSELIFCARRHLILSPSEVDKDVTSIIISSSFFSSSADGKKGKRQNLVRTCMHFGNRSFTLSEPSNCDVSHFFLRF